MRGRPRTSTAPASLGLLLLVLAAALLSAGCTGTAPRAGDGAVTTPPAAAVTTPQAGQAVVTTPPGVRDYMVHVPGRDRGTLLLVGRSNCPWCVKEKAFLTNLSVGFWWVDLNTLDQGETSEVMATLAPVKGCEKISGVPILVVRGEQCIIGYQEQAIREAIG